MTDAHTQKKSKKSGKGSSAKKTQSTHAGHGSSSHSPSFSSTLLWIPVAVAAAAYCYLNPQVVTDLINEWIGFSEHYDSAPVAQAPVYSVLAADYEKRDAVVAAFKHSWHAYERDAMGDDEYHPISRQGSNH